MSTLLGHLAGLPGADGGVGKDGKQGPKGPTATITVGKLSTEVTDRVNSKVAVSFPHPFTAPPELLAYVTDQTGDYYVLHVLTDSITATGFNATIYYHANKGTMDKYAGPGSSATFKPLIQLDWIAVGTLT